MGLGSREAYRKGKNVWTAAQAAKAVGLVEQLDQGQTTFNRALAELRLDEKLQTVHRELETGGQIDHLETSLGADGKEYPRHMDRNCWPSKYSSGDTLGQQWKASRHPPIDGPDYYRIVPLYLAGFSPHAGAGNLYLCPNCALVSTSLPPSPGTPDCQAQRQAVLADLGLGPQAEEDEMSDGRTSSGLG